MDLFISWSKPLSQAVAVLLRNVLPGMLAHRIDEPFVSSEAIDKGERGLTKIADELEKARFGIVVVTPQNQNETWLNFEAGALGKSVSTSRVAPVLINMTDKDLVGPMRQFQNSEVRDREGMLGVVKSINKSLDDPLPLDTLITLFDAKWPALDAEIETVLANAGRVPASLAPRSNEDMLAELLSTVRGLRRDINAQNSPTPAENLLAAGRKYSASRPPAGRLSVAMDFALTRWQGARVSQTQDALIISNPSVHAATPHDLFDLQHLSKTIPGPVIFDAQLTRHTFLNGKQIEVVPQEFAEATDPDRGTEVLPGTDPETQ